MPTTLSFDQWLAVAGLAFGAVGLLATIAMTTIWAVNDARRQRTERERAAIVAHSVVERTYGLLIGMKPFIAPLGATHLAAIDDGLEAINQQRGD